MVHIKQNQYNVDQYRMRIVLNGQDASIEAGWSVSDLISSLGLTPDRLAVEHNRRILRRAEWEGTILAENDRVEIVQFVGGGDSKTSGQQEK